MNKETDWKLELDKSLNRIEVPASLLQFAQELPDRMERGEVRAVTPLTSGRRNIRAWRTFGPYAAAAAAVVITFSASVEMSPAFASYMKSVPGFNVAVDWLTQVRSRDGVQVAVDNGYTPIEPVTTEFGGTTITIGDIYLTDDELLFKAFIRTNEFDITDGRSPVHYYVGPTNLRGGGSSTGASIAQTTDGTKQPVMQISYKYQLEENAVHDFFASGQKALMLEVTKHTVNTDVKRVNREVAATLSVPVDKQKLLHNKVYEPKQALPVNAHDPDLKQLTLEKLTVQPTTMNAVISGNKELELYYSRDEAEEPFLKDASGKVYRYDPSGPVLMLGDGISQLPFSSSVFFDKNASGLELHIGTVFVTERAPSGSFELSMEDSFPKEVRFKNRTIVIEAADYNEEGYLHLKVRKDPADQSGLLRGVQFFVSDFYERIVNDQVLRNKLDALRLKLDIAGFGTGESKGSQPFYDLYLPAEKQDKYNISMQRANDPVVVNQDYPVSLGK